MQSRARRRAPPGLIGWPPESFLPIYLRSLGWIWGPATWRTAVLFSELCCEESKKNDSLGILRLCLEVTLKAGFLSLSKDKFCAPLNPGSCIYRQQVWRSGEAPAWVGVPGGPHAQAARPTETLASAAAAGTVQAASGGTGPVIFPERGSEECEELTGWVGSGAPQGQRPSAEMWPDAQYTGVRAFGGAPLL